MEEILNAPKFETMEQMREHPRNYLTAGCDEMDRLTTTAMKVLYGRAEKSIIALPYGTFGRSGLTSVIRLFGANGGHIVAPNSLFGGTWAYLKMVLLAAYGGEVTFVDDINDPDQLRQALRPDTRLFLCEVASNPMLVVTDLGTVIPLVREYSPEAIIMVDDTLNAGSAILEKFDGKEALYGEPFSPLHFGADIAAYSLTKHTAAFGDERGGLLIGRNREVDFEIAGRNKLMDVLQFLQTLEGTHIHPSVAVKLTQRLGGLPVRQQRANRVAQIFAQKLKTVEIPKKARVFYPGLKSHPTHDNGLKNGMEHLFGSLVTVDVGSMGKAAEVGNAWAKAGIVTISNSFGEKDTLCEAVVYCMPKHADLLRSMGISDGVIRVALGWGQEVVRKIEEQAQEAADILNELL